MTKDSKFVIGIDFGTLSGRASIIRVSDGLEKGSSVIVDYPSAVMDRTLDAADGQKLPPEFALQDPADYIHVLSKAVPAAMNDADITADQVVGLGIDFTSATVVAAKEDGTPLCELEEFRNRPHAWVKLWKHHGGQEQATRIVEVAKERGETWLGRYGNTISSELLLPKVLETLEEDPEVYAATDVFVNALDWIVWRMTGTLVQSAGDSGYKRMFQDGQYPSREYLEALNPEFGGIFEEKMAAPVAALASKAGELNEEFASLMGLAAGTAVAVGNIDAHVTAAAVKAVEAGQLTAILGTSAVYVVSGPDLVEVPGMFGVVDGGIVDGLWGFEGGQSAVGDIFGWFVDHSVPPEYHEAAKKAGKSVHDYLTDLGANQQIGEHGLVALDWHGGNRSVLVDTDLSGLMIGTTLTTRPEDQYRALLESTAFGARMIVDTFKEHGVEINEFVAAGGLLKNKFLMQLFSDVTRLPISVATAAHAGALGSAVHAAVAAGEYETIQEASEAMGGKVRNAYLPSEQRATLYDELYAEYVQLHDYFGRGGNELMHRLKAIRARAAARGAKK
ncbi:ribulokinase [Georgenia sp. Z1344]|uniref:ribulokinase n=1 Tax=Georgenia sp. Z1344 TaxID=3416706 RepID=UPI003CF757A4